MTLRTVTIATGMIDGDLLRAVITLGDMASKVRGATLLDIPHGPGVTGQHAIPDLRAIRRTVEADDLRHLEHVGLPIRGRA